MAIRRDLRTLIAWIVAGLFFGLLVACGGDDNGASAEDRFCDAGDQLRAQISDLSDFNVVEEGTGALEDRLDEIAGTVEDLRDAGSEVAQDEISALDTALDDLESSVDELGGEDLTAENAQAVVDSVLDVAAAANQVLTTLRDTCE